MSLRIDKVTKSFGGAMVLNEVTFNVQEGSIKGLIGPNGAGKTTLFNVITSLYSPDGGDIHFDGRNLTRLRPDQIARIGIGRTFQKPSVAWHLTVFENVLLGSMNNRKYGFGASRTQRKEWTGHCLEICKIDPGLWHCETSRVGIAVIKKIELARAISLSPVLILFDELCSGLSHAETDDLLCLIQEYEAAHGCSVLFVEHDLRAVQNLCREVVVLDFGSVIFNGDIRDAFADPRVIEAYIGRRDA